MLESDFWKALEFRVCRDLQLRADNRLRFLWCDGFIPESYLLDQRPPRITGRAWIGDGRTQVQWTFTLLTTPPVSSPSDLDWDSLLPPEHANQWLAVDPQSGHIVMHPAAPVASEPANGTIEIIDYNGFGVWSPGEILARYGQYARELGIVPRDLSPAEDSHGNRRWIYPVMHRVINGIKAGDAACIRLGIEFIEEDTKFPFGKVLKSNTARALRRSELSEEQKQRIRRRVFGLLGRGIIPHEYKNYARLVRKIGFSLADVPPVDEKNGRAVRFRRYFEEAARVDEKNASR
jgi:hypothetical protein